MRIRVQVPEGLKEFCQMLIEETLALLALAAFLLTVAVWTGMWCRVF